MNIIWVLFGVNQKRNLNTPEKKNWIRFWASGYRQAQAPVDRCQSGTVLATYRQTEPRFFSVYRRLCLSSDNACYLSTDWATFLLSLDGCASLATIPATCRQTEPRFFSVVWRSAPHCFFICLFFLVLFLFQLDWIFFDYHLLSNTRQFHNNKMMHQQCNNLCHTPSAVCASATQLLFHVSWQVLAALLRIY